jgi:Tol biopolymer transport system component
MEMPTESKGRKVPQVVERWQDSATKQFRRHYLGSSLWSILGVIIVVLIVVWSLVQFNVLSPSGLAFKEKAQSSQPQNPQPQYEAIGVYQDQAYFFNESTQKMYIYDAQTDQEEEAFNLVQYDAFVWSPSGSKIVFVSRERNRLGNLYVVNLDKSTIQPQLITTRETGINFPSDVGINGDLPLAWNESGDRIAFAARRQAEDKDALFVVSADGNEYYSLPEKDRITSLTWSGDKVVFVAFENGQEKRFVVNYDGGSLKEIK